MAENFCGKGNASLPIASFKKEIVDAVRNNNCVIITAETGSGKSTQVPQFLLGAGYRVVVTEPRKLAARSVSERVAEEWGCPFGELIGYRTGDSQDRHDSSSTRLLFCTDGLQVVRELTDSGKAEVLVIDEVHEWNLNIETLVAWARKRLNDGDANFKVVIMSATLESEKLSEFFSGAPVINVPGRLFPVEMKSSSDDISSEAKRLVSQGKNILVFQPGKAEIVKTISELEGCGAMVLPLHGELTPEEQKKCFRHYDVPKVIVATNVAQTSVTVDDIDAVVDSGIERGTELADGIEGLYLKEVSQADAKQRAGRAGRTKDGVYVLCSRTSLEERPAFGKAEIERSRLDQLVLRLAVAGFDATDLEFFHQPDKEVLTEAKAALMRLGAMDDQEGNVTETGRMMSRMPVEVHIARMIVEASKRGVVSDVIDIAACMEVGGIQDRKGGASSLTEESSSDLLAELDIYKKALAMKDNEERQKAGIFMKAFWQAKEMSRRIAEAVYRFVDIKKSTGDRQEITKSCVAGMVDHLFQKKYDGYQNGGGVRRELEKKSVLNKGREPEWITGLPWDLEVPTRRGGKTTLHLVNWASKVDPMWLVEIAPQLSKTFFRNYQYDSSEGKMTAEKVMTFNNAEIKEERIVVEESNPDAVRAFALALADGKVAYSEKESNDQMLAEVKSVWACGADLKPVSQDQFVEFFISRIGTAYSLSLLEGVDLKLTDGNVGEILEVDYPSVREIARQSSPDFVQIDGQDFSVKYSRDTYNNKVNARVDLAENFVRAASDTLSEFWVLDKVCLLHGQQVELVCSGHIAMTFSGLLAKLEAARVSMEWSKIKNTCEKTFYKPEEVYLALEKIDTSVEVCQDSAGWPIMAWFGLRYSWGDWRLTLYQNQEQAQTETKGSLAELAKKSLESVIVPKQEPFYKDDSWYGKKITELGSALEKGLKNILEKIKPADLNPQNIVGVIEQVKKEALELISQASEGYNSSVNLINETESKIKEEVLKVGDNEIFVSSEISQANSLLSIAKESLKKLAYQEVSLACEQAQAIIGEIVDQAQERAEAHTGFETLTKEVRSILYDIEYSNDDYDRRVYSKFSGIAGELRSELKNALDAYQYDKVSTLIQKAISFFSDIEIAIEQWEASQALIAEHLKSTYSKTIFFERDELRTGSYISMYDSETVFDAVYQEIESQRSEGREYARFMEARLGEQVISWLDGYIYRDDEIQFYICLAENLILKPSDMSKIEVVSLWSPPNHEWLEKMSHLRNLRNRLNNLEAEAENCEGDYPSRVCLKFEKDPDRDTLFAIVFMPEISVDTPNNGYEPIGGSVRFVCDPDKCGWLEQKPVSGEIWFCSFKRMIGRDKKGRPVVVAIPQLRDDRKALRLEIERAEQNDSVSDALLDEPQGESDTEIESEFSLTDLMQRFGK